jgi:hypothetical protein
MKQILSLIAVLILGVGIVGCDMLNMTSAVNPTTFTVQIENISAPDTLVTSAGNSVPVLLAPGVYAIHTADGLLFRNGEADFGYGLEALSEDGNPAELSAHLSNLTSIMMYGVFNTPVGAAGPGPLLPGSTYEFSFSAQPGNRLSFATMFVQSNDLFYAPRETGVFLFDSSNKPIQGDITSQIWLWDDGVEINEEPGIGTSQAPRQSGPNMGTAESGIVHIVNDGYSYPDISNVIRVTIIPQS